MMAIPARVPDTRTAKVSCPYCGHVNTVRICRDDELRPIVILCDIEEGPGCDRFFAAQIAFRPSIEVFSLEPAQERRQQEEAQ